MEIDKSIEIATSNLFPYYISILFPYYGRGLVFTVEVRIDYNDIDVPPFWISSVEEE
jgi:hypothetical protein